MALSGYILSRTSGIALAVAALIPVQASAQDAAPVAGADGASGKNPANNISGVTEILVTAQKRETNLQDTPVAVSVVTAEDLDAKQIVNLEDIRNLVPNLYLEQALSGTTTPKMFIRGVGVDNQVFSFDSPIGLYFDDVYISRVTGALVDMFDVQQVEFLRGPQGTLFGRNSSAGALRIRTKSASVDNWDGKVSLAYGTRNQFNAHAAAGGPIVQDKLGVRIAFSSRTNDGFQTDQTGERFMNNDIQAVRGSILFRPSPNWDFTLRGDYMRDRSKPTQPSNFRINPDNNLFTFERTLSAPNYNRVEPWGTSLTIDGDLGNVNLKSITAYRQLKFRNGGDADGRADVQSFEVQQQDLDENQFSQEVYLTGKRVGSLPLAWTVGAFYLHEKNKFDWALRIFAPPTTQHFVQNTDSVAIYSQATLSATDRWNLTGGLRYTYEKKALSATQSLPNGAPNPGFQFKDSITANEVNWHASTDYHISDEVMLYASSGTGFRSGGFNGSARDIPSILSGSFKPETVFNIEGGAKTEFFDRRLRLNFNYYWTEYRGLQQAVTLSDGTISTRNVSATVQGLEAELNAVPFDGFEISASLGTANDNIKNSTLRLKDTPRIRWRIGAIYRVELPGNSGSLRFGGDLSHSSSFFNGTNNELAGLVAPYETVNAQIAYRTPDEHWQFKLSGTNLTNHIFAAHTFDIARGFISSVDYPTTPRRYLVTVDYSF